VNFDKSRTLFDITLTARVDVVDRSANALAPQAKIIIHYGGEYYVGIVALDGHPPILKIGEKVKAYLKKNGNEYRLAGDIGCLEKL
jgi:hypothetical protein